jgi:hypothetical protein
LATSDLAPIPDIGRGRQHVRKVPISDIAALHATRANLPFNLMRDIAPVARIGGGNLVIVVP